MLVRSNHRHSQTFIKQWLFHTCCHMRFLYSPACTNAGTEAQKVLCLSPHHWESMEPFTQVTVQAWAVLVNSGPSQNSSGLLNHCFVHMFLKSSCHLGYKSESQGLSALHQIIFTHERKDHIYYGMDYRSGKWSVVEEDRVSRLIGQDRGQTIKLKEWARRHARPVPRS